MLAVAVYLGLNMLKFPFLKHLVGRLSKWGIQCAIELLPLPVWCLAQTACWKVGKPLYKNHVSFQFCPWWNQGHASLYIVLLNSNWIPSAPLTTRYWVLAVIFCRELWSEMNLLLLLLTAILITLPEPTTGFRRQITLNIHWNTFHFFHQEDILVKQIFTKKYHSLHAAFRDSMVEKHTVSVKTYPLP